VTKRDSLLFVYGTLRAFVDIPMARLLRAQARHLGTARTRGRLYDLGPYPGMTSPQRTIDWVTGDLYALRAPRALLGVLDAYEAGDVGRERPRFVRARAVVTLDGGRRRLAWLYLYRPPVRASHRIRGGDYRAHLGGGYVRAPFRD
jgi:gamma-glutamylcyclotransferase (GGCT)/AIG2-like uncharacterized protein YtfP